MTEPHRREGVSIVWLVGLVAFACLVRLGYLWFISRTPGFTWIDPDQYLDHGVSLIGDGTKWRWTVEAVRYRGPFFKAPLYPIFLSLFARLPPGIEWSAALSHVALGAIGVMAVWWLTRELHSERGAWIAAVACALYFPDVVGTGSFMQERLYLPLLIVAFAQTARAMRSGSDGNFLLAGLVLGCSALARSMPIYYVGPAALLLAVDGRGHRGIRRGLVYLGGFLAIVLPYSVFISWQVGHVLLIENIAAFPFGVDSHGAALTSTGMAGALWHSLRAAPLAFARSRVDLMLMQFRVGGGRWLQITGGLGSALEAEVARVYVHLCGDVPLLVATVAAPLGLIVAKRRPIAALLGLWILVHLAMTAMSGYAGQRFREPVDWTLLVLAACALSGQWQRPRWFEAVPAVAVAAVLFFTTAATVAESFRARADYGIARWQYGSQSRRTTGVGDAGLTIYPVRGVAEVLVKNADRPLSIPLGARVDGVAVQGADLGDGDVRVRFRSPKSAVYLELLRATPATARWSIEVLNAPFGSAAPMAR